MVRDWRNLVLGVLSVLAAGLVPATSRADFLFFTGNPDGYRSTLNEQGLSEGNVLFNAPGLADWALQVSGQVPSGPVIDFASDETLTTPSNGQARVEAADGAFTSLAIRPDDPTTAFDCLGLDVNVAEKVGGNLVLTLIDAGGHSRDVSTEVRAGLTFFGVLATGGDLFGEVRLSGGPAITDVRQVRLGARALDTVQVLGDGNPAVPEPSTWVLLGIGVVSLAAPLLRRLARPASLEPRAGG